MVFFDQLMGQRQFRFFSPHAHTYYRSSTQIPKFDHFYVPKYSHCLLSSLSTHL